METEGARIAAGAVRVLCDTVRGGADMARDKVALERRVARVRVRSVEHCGLYLELVLHRLDQLAVYVLVYGLARRKHGPQPVVPPRAVGPLRSDAAVRGGVRRWHDLLLPQAGAHLLDQPASGTAAGFARPHDHRHHQVLLHLHAGPVRLRVWPKPAAVVLRRAGEEQVLPSAVRVARL
uniref:(northern house mosquito) hypothetical protein n=1 Tax=Culex pipiens TaxID=7175 RepID=A0A8D8GV70_CULPI